MKKAARAETAADLEPVMARDGFDCSLIKGFHRAGCLAHGGAECRKVMLAHQCLRGLMHGDGIERVVAPPDKARFMRHRCPAAHDPVKVPSLHRPEPGVPVVRDLCGRQNGDRRRFKVIVQRLAEPKRIPDLCKVAMGDLSCSVHTSIGAPSGCDAARRRVNLGQRGFNRALDRRMVILPLPAGKRTTMIFNFERITRHASPYRQAVAPATGLAKRPGHPYVI